MSDEPVEELVSALEAGGLDRDTVRAWLGVADGEQRVLRAAASRNHRLRERAAELTRAIRNDEPLP